MGGLLGTSDTGLIDTALAARLGERCGLRSGFSLEDWNLFPSLVFHLNSRKEASTHVDLGTIEAVLVHDPAESQKKRQR